MFGRDVRGAGCRISVIGTPASSSHALGTVFRLVPLLDHDVRQTEPVHRLFALLLIDLPRSTFVFFAVSF
jgi:hypothetical protein